MNHRLEVAHVVILAMFALFVVFIGLFALNSQISGKATSSTTVFVINVSDHNCTLLTGTGYNIISLPCLQTATPISFISSNASILAMYQYVPGDADPWRVYNQNLPSYVVSDLQYLTRRAGYVLIVSAPSNQTIVGIEAAMTDVPLASGWNLAGYPAFSTRNASDVFANISGATEIVAYNKSTERFVSYPGDLEFIVPGEGYWINVTNGTSWSVIP